MKTADAPPSAVGRREPPRTAADRNERFARLMAWLDRQDEEWNRARRTLVAFEAATVQVPKAFLDQLDELVDVRPLQPNGVRA